MSVGKVAKFIGDVVDNKTAKKPIEFAHGSDRQTRRQGPPDYHNLTVPRKIRIRMELEEGVIKAAAMGRRQVVMTYAAGRQRPTTAEAGTPT